MGKFETETIVTVRGIDKNLWRKARLAALEANQDIGEWVNDAISEKMKLTEEDKNRDYLLDANNIGSVR